MTKIVTDELAMYAQTVAELREHKRILLQAIRVLPNKNAMESLREHHEAMEAMRDRNDMDTAALGLLIGLYDRVVAAKKRIGDP